MKIIHSKETLLEFFLTAQYKSGLNHISNALKINSPSLSNNIYIEKNRAQSSSRFHFPHLISFVVNLKERTTHLALGVLECIPLVGLIVNIAERFFTKKKPSCCIKTQLPIPKHQYHWFLNLAMLRSAYDKAQGSEKQHIAFLAANFLNKVTPKSLNRWVNEVRQTNPNYITHHIGSPIDEYSYHRENIDHYYLYGKKFNEELAFGNQSLFVLTDTIELDPALSLAFILINKKQPKSSYKQTILDQLRQHLNSTLNASWDKNFAKPFVVDLTEIVDASIHTHKDKNKQHAFQKSLEEFEKLFLEAQNEAIQELIIEHPELKDQKKTILARLQKNTSCIHKVSGESYQGIKFLPFGCNKTLDDQANSPLVRFHKPNDLWVNYITSTGLYINAIDLRKKIDNVFEQRPDVSYLIDEDLSQTQLQTLYYPSKQDFLNTKLFQRLSCLYHKNPEINETQPSLYGINLSQLKDNINLMKDRPHMMVMGKLSLDLIQGLMREISDEKWQQIHSNPVYLQIFQSSLFLIQQHFAASELLALANKFDEFMEKIELIHAELATLLELTKPFSEHDFQGIYENVLQQESFPLHLNARVTCGLAKSATNVFLGALCSASKQDGHVESVAGSNSYYEHDVLTHHKFDAYMKNPSAPKVHLYHGQFYPNVSVGSSPITYEKKDIAADIKALLNANKVTQNFTVAIDTTIDNVHSDAVKDLLATFQQEIAEGRVNFLFFASGQKFYNVGMDHYYAAPFYMVNNGDDKWKDYDDLCSHSLYRPDILSTQWFNLSLKYASDGLNDYRSLIFDNTKAILTQLPASLAFDSQKKQHFYINGAADTMKPPFIDLKVVAKSNSQESKCKVLKKRFFKMLENEDMEACTRGSFGFFHCNFSVFGHLDDNVRTVRINPGINPNENEKILKFLKETAESNGIN